MGGKRESNDDRTRRNSTKMTVATVAKIWQPGGKFRARVLGIEGGDSRVLIGIGVWDNKHLYRPEKSRVRDEHDRENLCGRLKKHVMVTSSRGRPVSG